MATLVAAVLLRLALDPLMGDSLPLVTVFGAIAVAVWIGGFGPAIVVATLGYLACVYLFMEPRGTLEFGTTKNVVGLIAYAFTSGIIIFFGHVLLGAKHRAEVAGEHLRITIASVGDAVITTNAQGQVESLNPVAEKLIGWTNEEAQGKLLETVFQIVDEQTRERGENPVQKVLRLGRATGLANHTVLIAKDGSERSIDDSAAPILDRQGQTVGVVLVFHDVTEQRRLERESAERMRAARFLASIVESSDDAIVSKSLAGIIQSWNAAAERLFGYTTAEAVGKSIKMLIPPERLAEEERIIASITRGERVDHFETIRVRKDGQRFPVSLTISPIRDDSGKIIGASKIVRDITERERLLQAERESRALLHATLVGIGDAVIATDNEGRVVFMNPIAIALTGWTEEEAKGQALTTVFQIVNETTRQEVENPALRALREGTIVGLANHTVLIAKDGVERPIDDSAAPIKGVDGKTFGAVLVFRDITVRRAAEHELRRVAAELSEADRRKDEFLATLAHELRNPLAPLRNGLHILRLSGDSPDAVQQTRAMMERQLTQMVRLVDDLLDISRISRGKIELRQERMPLGAVIHSALETSGSLLSAAGHELIVDIPKEPIFVDADLTRLSQVFANLLNNAAKYTERGGRVWLQVTPQDDAVAVTVRDSGLGIPAEMLPRVFEMFTQIDRHLDRSQGGLGIGLTLSKRLVELHGGTIAASSEGEGKGSTFTVRLPVVDVNTAMPSSTPATDTSTSRPARRILVADDNADAVNSLAGMLRLIRHEVRIANDGAEAVVVAEAFQPDLVFLDIGMPKLNGYEACRQLKEQPWSASTTFVALTGWGQEEDKRKSRAAGFDEHLTKPVDYNALVRLLKN